MSGSTPWKIAMSVLVTILCLVYSIASGVAAKCMSDGNSGCLTTSGATAACAGLSAAACLGLAIWYWTRGGGGGL